MKDDFELNPKAITEQKDYKDKIQILIDQANICLRIIWLLK